MNSQPGVGLADYGSTLVKTGVTISGNYWAFVCIGACVFTTLTDAANTASAWDGVSLADGTTVYGHFTDGILSLGTAIFYKTKV